MIKRWRFASVVWTVGDPLKIHENDTNCTCTWSENAQEMDQILRLQLFTGDELGISLTLLQYIGLLDRCAVSRYN